jgi:type II secretory pathway pseudopilin PulG
MNETEGAPSPQRTKALSRGFTLVEMLTTMAILIVVFGLMVSLARYVRDNSAQELTASILDRLERALAAYRDDWGNIPPVPPLIGPGPLPDEAMLRRNALANNRAFVRALRPYLTHQASRDESTTEPGGFSLEQLKRQGLGKLDWLDALDELSLGTYDEITLCDAWGEPIVFMPHMHEAIGMAPPDRPYFFFSAGPDGRYLTRDDNLYSYELNGYRSNN